MTEDKKIDIILDAFKHRMKVKVTRDCFEAEEVCVGLIRSVSYRKSPKSGEEEFCFSMCSSGKWWESDTLMSLAPWVSQIEIVIVEQ